MALTGLDIYKLLPRTNCKDCGYATCLAFAMALAQKKVSLGKCPHVSAQAKEALESASQPPVKLVTIGAGGDRRETGNETVMYRHEQKFYHPTIIGVVVDDTLDDSGLDEAIERINSLVFERIGQRIGVDLVCIRNLSGYRNKFANAVRTVSAATKLAVALYAEKAEPMAEAVRICADRRPLVIAGRPAPLDEFIALAKGAGLPIAVTAGSLDEAAASCERAKAAGIEEIVINFDSVPMSRRIQDMTFARRMALRSAFRSLGYPLMAFTMSKDSDLELAEAVSYMAKYAGVTIVQSTDREFIYPLLVARQDIYQDPQKPVQVEPKVYEIGRVTDRSPVMVTTNFSITYFTVAGEVESSKVPAYVICCDAEGMSVLTAWAAEKFTAERIADMLGKCGIADKVSHRNVILPGYVAVLSGKLEEASGWKALVGPREASGITTYLRNLKQL
jgi:acetyl-CoA decarbonylase/synthase complex subunit gamma